MMEQIIVFWKIFGSVSFLGEIDSKERQFFGQI